MCKKLSGTTLMLSALVLGSSLLGSSIALGATVIKLAHPNVPEHPMGQAFEKFKEMVEERSGGDITVDVYDSSKFGNFDSVVQGLQFGLLQMGSASTPNLSPFSKDFMIFDLPFLFPSYEATDLITDGPIGQNAAEALLDTGIMGLGYIEIGFRHIFNGTRTVATPADTDGLKIRSTPSKVHIATLDALGTNPTPVAWSEVYTALQQQTVDGIDIDLNLAWFNNFHEVNKNLTLLGSTYTPHLVMMSKSFFDGLSSEHQTLVSDAFAEMQQFQRQLIRENETMIIEKMKENGVEIVELTDEQRSEWQASVQSVYDEFAEQVGPELIEQARQTIGQ